LCGIVGRRVWTGCLVGIGIGVEVVVQLQVEIQADLEIEFGVASSDEGLEWLKEGGSGEGWIGEWCGGMCLRLLSSESRLTSEGISWCKEVIDSRVFTQTVKDKEDCGESKIYEYKKTRRQEDNDLPTIRCWSSPRGTRLRALISS
jgi:hypothetical protein